MPEKAAAMVAAAALEDLLSTFRGEAEDTRAAINEHEANRVRQLRWLIALIGIMAVVLALVLVVLLQNRQKSAEGRELVRRNAAVSQQIADCTTNRASACYQEQQRRSGEAIGKLTDRITAVIEEIAVCDKTTDTVAEQRACVDRALKKIGKVGAAP